MTQRSGFRRAAMGLALLALLALVGTPASARPTKPRFRTATSAAPNGFGWHARPASASIRVAFATTLDVCGRGTITVRPDGIGIGAATFERGAIPSSTCSVSAFVRETGTEEVTLWVTAGEWSDRADVAVRVDRDRPSVAITPEPPVALAVVDLRGTVSDGFSGPAAVTLEFHDPLGRQGSLREPADCSGCGVFPPCAPGACGSANAWRFRGEVPSGTWRVTPEASDLAGNTARGEPVDIVVL